jgi:hypothetical protein
MQYRRKRYYKNEKGRYRQAVVRGTVMEESGGGKEVKQKFKLHILAYHT